MAKQKRDAVSSKLNILTEARMLFSKKGYDATTMDDIAKVSGINKALIYYYFQNKSGLYGEIMSELFSEIHNEIIMQREHCSSLEDELEAFIKTYAVYAYNNPYFPALLLRELSDSGAHLPETMFTNMRKLFTLLSDILLRGEKAGIFNKSLPMVIHFMIIGTLNLMFTTQTLREKTMLLSENIDTCANCSVEEISEYIFQSIKKSLKVT